MFTYTKTYAKLMVSRVAYDEIAKRLKEQASTADQRARFFSHPQEANELLQMDGLAIGTDDPPTHRSDIKHGAPPERAVICNAGAIATIVFCRGHVIEQEVQSLGRDADEHGLGDPPPGISVFEGYLKTFGPLTEGDYDADWHGRYREPTEEEWQAIRRGVCPWPPLALEERADPPFASVLSVNGRLGEPNCELELRDAYDQVLCRIDFVKIVQLVQRVLQRIDNPDGAQTEAHAHEVAETVVPIVKSE